MTACAVCYKPLSDAPEHKYMAPNGKSVEVHPACCPRCHGDYDYETGTWKGSGSNEGQSDTDGKSVG